MTAPFIAVIPARYGSTRLPGKPLADIGGRPMIAWVHERACSSGATDVIVATDDERIVAACHRFGARVELTSARHPSGTDRIAELAERSAWDDAQIVVNVQGDEPMIPPALIEQVANLLARHPEAAVATLVAPIRSEAEWRDENVAKVIVDREGYALYFSRAPIPYPRDGALTLAAARRHVGLYAYRVGALKAIAAAAPCPIEQVESLEQLRALWLGYRIVVETAAESPSRHVETAADLAEVREALGRG